MSNQSAPKIKKHQSAKKADDFVHIHVHSDQSQLDGAGKIAEYVKVAKERNHRAIAFTEHGTMRGYHTLLLATKEHDIKPIYGVEFYVCANMERKGATPEEKQALLAGKTLNRGEQNALIREYEKNEGLRAGWHLCAWAENMEGLRNLFRLTSAAWIDGFYYKPRIDLDLLLRYQEGIRIGSACASGLFNQQMLVGRKKRALEVADKLFDTFRDRMWLEVMPHHFPEQAKANKFTLELHDRYNGECRLIATQDAHYVLSGDWKHHEVMLAIGTNDKMSNPERFKFTDGAYHFRTRQEMADAFGAHHSYMSRELVKQALDNTTIFADGCDVKVEIDRFKCLMPELEMPEQFGKDEEGEIAYLKHLCMEGWTWRDIAERAAIFATREGRQYEDVYKDYIDRLKMELGAIIRQKFVSYFLLVHDIYVFARRQGIACGPGRGSAAGSLVSFLIGVTSVDPVEHKLLFERFINPDRIDMPDVDMDFEDARRQEIFDYLIEKYGRDKVCQIATIGKLSGKQCIKDIARVYEVPYAEVNEITNSIIERSSGDERASQTIEDSFKDFEVCRRFNKKYPMVLEHAKRLEGLAKNLGIHAAGLVCSPVPLTDLIPLEARKQSDGEPVIVSAVDMYGCQDVGLLKLDILGLRTMTVLRETVEAIKERHNIDIDLERLQLNEPDILQGFTNHDYVGIFQYDSAGADKICSGVSFDTFDDVAVMVALNRPGTARSGLSTQYVARKKKPELVKQTAFHPKVSEITADTLGIIVYQEHVIKIFMDIAGFAPSTADSLRKAIAKKWGDETIGKQRENFIKGAVKRTPGMTEKIAAKLMDAITFFGSYAFNRSHSTAYGMIAYWGMFAKQRYPLEFYWALLKNEPTRIKVQQIAKDAKAHGIEILSPDVNVSKTGFAIDSEANAIRGSLVDIKNVGEKAAESIMETQPFEDFSDFMERVNRRKVNKRVVRSLALSGALDKLLPNVKWFVEQLDAPGLIDLWKTVTNKSWKQVRAMLQQSKTRSQWSEEEKMMAASQVSPLAFGQHPVDAYKDFIERCVKVPIADMSHEDFFKDYNNKGCYVLGMIVEVKYNQIGDFHTGVLPDEEERLRMGWGKRYANINVEDVGGKQNRIKVDWDIFDDFREIVDAGVGTPVVLHAVANARYGNMRAQFLINLEAYRQKANANKELTVWERIIGGQHPISTYPWKSKANRRAAMLPLRGILQEAEGVYIATGNAQYNVTGVISHVKAKLDKRMHAMAFFGILGYDGFIEVVCFGSSWPSFKKYIQAGRLVTLRLSCEGSSNFLHSDTGRIWLLNQQNRQGDKP